MTETEIITPTIEELAFKEQELKIQRDLSLKKAFESNNVSEIMKAQVYMKQLQEREKVDFKSILVDPLDTRNQFGYKQKPFSLSFDVLKNMSKTHVIKAIIETRKDQIASFCTPQQNQYSTGFIIQKKAKYQVTKKEVRLSKEDEKRIEDIVEFLLGCGNTENYWHADTFETFIGKIVQDSLTLDQATAECVRNKKGDLVEFFATDGSSYRIADSFEEEQHTKFKEKQIKGYTPSYVQLYQNNIIAEFYPWELIWGVRNPMTDIRTNGYGKSELEDMIQTVTAILQSDFYNANFFKVGSAPKGILKYSGNINQNTVEDFRRQWVAQVAGVSNMHKMPIINADKMDFINLQQNNKDMEFSKYQEFLIKISCALYKIDPSEIGFPMSGSSDSKPMFEGNNEARLKYSRDKGLKPLLKKIESWINKWIIYQLDPSFEFRFVGIDDINSQKDDLDQDIQRLSNFMTVDEIRAKYNMEPMPDENGQMILNPTYYQNVQAKAMAAQQGNQGANEEMSNMYGGEGDENNPFNPKQENVDDKETEENNPFLKALSVELPELLNK